MAVLQILNDDISQLHDSSGTLEASPQQHQYPLYPDRVGASGAQVHHPYPGFSEGVGASGAQLLALPVTVADFARPLDWLQRTATAMRIRQRQTQRKALTTLVCKLLTFQPCWSVKAQAEGLRL
jgi:hypothetical protein